MPRPVAVGLVGCGRWGRLILRDLLALGCTVSVVDPDASSRAAAAGGGAREVFADLERLPPVDGVVVATPATTHAEVLAALLARRIPVFCEKPFTTDVASARRLAASAGGMLFVMHVWRYHRGVLALAALARSGELGRVLSLSTERKNWTSPRTDTDAVWTLVPHDLTIALAVLGAIPAPVAARAELIDGRAVAITGILGTAPFAVFECSTRFREKRRGVRLHCEGGVAVLPDTDSDGIEILRPNAPPDAAPVVERRMLSGEPALLAELRAFVDHLRGGPPPPTDAAEGLAVVETIAALRRLAGLP